MTEDKNFARFTDRELLLECYCCLRDLFVSQQEDCRDIYPKVAVLIQEVCERAHRPENEVAKEAE